MLIGGALVLGVLEVIVAVTASYPISLVAMFGIGAGGIAMAATGNTMIQLAVPDALRGRVMSVYTTVFAGSAPIGGLLFGSIASGFGASAALLVGGIASVSVVLLAALAVRGTSVGLRSSRLRPAAGRTSPIGSSRLKP